MITCSAGAGMQRKRRRYITYNLPTGCVGQDQGFSKQIQIRIADLTCGHPLSLCRSVALFLSLSQVWANCADVTVAAAAAAV